MKMPDMQQIYEFLNSIEGAGYGGMAEYEIAREAARSLAGASAQGEMPEAIRVPLHELQADVEYLIGRLLEDKSCRLMVAESIKGKLQAIETAVLDGIHAERTEDSAFEEIMRHVNAMRLSRVSEGLDRIEEICKRQSRQSPAVTETCMLCADDDSPGFYQGCMVRDGHAPEWDCDGKGNLTRRSQPVNSDIEAHIDQIAKDSPEVPRSVIRSIIAEPRG
jgi:hypothetical protein